MIQFILNNQIIRTAVNSGVTLLDFVRDHNQLKGTKIGCREGDCGACTVLVGELKNDAVSYKSITSCIYPLGNANGKHIVTIEGINLSKELNIAQKSMSESYATQCGFCTPGFVVSLTGYTLQKTAGANTVTDAISGNICRCTGYKSIEKAAKLVDDRLANNKEVNKLGWLIKEKFIPNYFKHIPEKLKTLELKTLKKEGVIVANGTDIYVRHADRLSEVAVHLIVEDESLKGIEMNEDICTVGANTTVSEILDNSQIRSFFPKLKSFLKLVSSEQIRNMGTLGGNFVNASPIGDMSVFFLALDSTLVIKNKAGIKRSIQFKSFHLDYKKYDLKEDELIESISFKIPLKDTRFNFEKVSKRTHLDIASVNSACKITMKKDVISEACIAIGGVAPIPKYLSKTSSFLSGKIMSTEIIKQAEAILQSEITPISDVRGASGYKRLLARQLFFTHFIELFPTKIKPETLLDL
ncbi:FAD binding domain-containing protein [Aquimarina sediminis]|uniref:FAD binding domain-containing protein n=1 Tax=Aquimarina sediminis TaxID=2070536 RepID=UPI000CA001ED|nr:FAD binding domain-containing protein [Aquimarina sediminis]